MAKLRLTINNYISCGGVGFTLSFAAIQELIYIYNCMLKNERPYVGNPAVNNELKRCGITTIPYYGGWKVVKA